MHDLKTIPVTDTARTENFTQIVDVRHIDVDTPLLPIGHVLRHKEVGELQATLEAVQGAKVEVKANILHERTIPKVKVKALMTMEKDVPEKDSATPKVRKVKDAGGRGPILAMLRPPPPIQNNLIPLHLL